MTTKQHNEYLAKYWQVKEKDVRAAKRIIKEYKGCTGVNDGYKALKLIGDHIGGYGVEVGKAASDPDKVLFEYINMGDTYDMTVVYFNETGRFAFTSWGDIVERNPNRYL
jgi:hypothetical protein